MDIVRLSENTLIVLFEQTISTTNLETVKRVTQAIKDNLSDNIIDIVPSYASIHITFNVLKISGAEFKTTLAKVVEQSDTVHVKNHSTKIIEISVYYGAEVALDLPYIAQRASLTEQEVINIHANKLYDVYAIGFAPGFAYLGNVDERIACPRKDTPREKIMQGSLGIAGKQTAIYPAASPGGWQIIGRTPIELINYKSEKLTPFSTGDKVKFKPIEKSDFLAMGGVL